MSSSAGEHVSLSLQLSHCVGREVVDLSGTQISGCLELLFFFFFNRLFFFFRV